MTDIERIVRERLCTTLNRSSDTCGLLDLDHSLGSEYGLSSLDLIVLMSSVCDEAEVPLTALSEDDIAALQTPSDIVSLLASKAP